MQAHRQTNQGQHWPNWLQTIPSMLRRLFDIYGVAILLIDRSTKYNIMNHTGNGRIQDVLNYRLLNSKHPRAIKSFGINIISAHLGYEKSL